MEWTGSPRLACDTLECDQSLGSTSSSCELQGRPGVCVSETSATEISTLSSSRTLRSLCHVGCPSTVPPRRPLHSGDCTSREGISMRLLSSQPRRLQGSIVLRQCRDPGTTYSCKPEMAALRSSSLGSTVHAPTWRAFLWVGVCLCPVFTKLLLALLALGLAGSSRSSLIYLPPNSLLRCAHLQMLAACKCSPPVCRTCCSHLAQ